MKKNLEFITKEQASKVSRVLNILNVGIAAYIGFREARDIPLDPSVIPILTIPPILLTSSLEPHNNYKEIGRSTFKIALSMTLGYAAGYTLGRIL
ncbi:hypothetical protein HYV88_06295 [Candidatus Woesearchaeota archaeon]|nr:hypothetical protein [Candidatus Woesearchaeota archaeon]